MPKETRINIRIPHKLKETAAEKAKKEYTTLTQVIINFLFNWVNEKK